MYLFIQQKVKGTNLDIGNIAENKAEEDTTFMKFTFLKIESY